MKLNYKVKTILSIVAFVVVFLTIFLVGTFLDFQVSEFLTKGVLPEGQYLANDFFGVMLECIGSTPIYFVIAFAACVLFWASVKLLSKKHKPLAYVLASLLAIGVAAAFWYALKDTMGYVFEHAIARSGYDYFNELDKLEHSAALYGIEAVFGAIMATLAIFATKHFNEETLKKLLKFVLVTAVALAVANLLIMIIKDPVGRMRYRAIKSPLGEALIESHRVKGYTPWYVANGQPKEAVSAFVDTYFVEDAFKSFPSGHTCAAGSVYCIMLLPDIFEFKKDKVKTGLCWGLPVLLVALVAISRIMVGAHYLTDVTMGGTIAFLCVMISREIFICKGSHFKVLFAGKGGAVAQDILGGDESAVIEDDAEDIQSDGEYADVDNADDIAEADNVDNVDSGADVDKSSDIASDTAEAE